MNTAEATGSGTELAILRIPALSDQRSSSQTISSALNLYSIQICDKLVQLAEDFDFDGIQKILLELDS